MQFSKNQTRKICMLGVLTAITVVLSAFCTVRVGNAIKIPTKFVSIFITGALFGPIASGTVSALGDVISAFAFPVGPWIPLITAIELLCGIIYGICFYRKKFDGAGYFFRCVICTVLLFAADMMLTTEVLVVVGYFPTFKSAFITRLTAGIIKATLQFIYMIMAVRMLPPLQKIIQTDDFKSYANSFQTVSKPGLERISALLELLGNPQKRLKCVHIAGTNGKGSTAQFLQCMFTHSGKKTGKYISPNMIKVNERISIDGVDIPDGDLNRILGKIEKFSPKVKKMTGDIPTQFEIWTAAAFEYFAEQKCDAVILEVGLGGRLDATNVIEKNLASVITRIDIDHTEYLGDTIEQIAGEKAGIIKKGSPVITVNDGTAGEVIRRKASEYGNGFYFVETAPPTEFKDIYEVFDNGKIRAALSLGGSVQLENASLAVKTAEVLGLSNEGVVWGLTHAVNPGRFEKVGDKMIYDGAHNPNGADALSNNLSRYYPDEKFDFVMAAMKDKDILTTLKILLPHANRFLFVKVKNNERCAEPDILAEKAREIGAEAEPCESIEGALKEAKRPCVICGSLYLYKDFKEINNN